MRASIIYGWPSVSISTFGLKRTMVDIDTVFNQLEVFKKYLKAALWLIVRTLVEVTFVRINTYFVNRKARYEKEVVTGNDFLKKVRQLLEDTEASSEHFKMDTYSYGEEYEKERMLVNLIM